MAKPKAKKPRTKRPEHWHELSPEDSEAIQGSGLGLKEFFDWKAWKKKREARAKRKAKIAEAFVAPERKTCVCDELKLRTTAGLPNNVRARLLYMASWERRSRISNKLVKLIEPLIAEGMSAGAAEILRVLELETPKLTYPRVVVVYDRAPKQASDYVYGCGLGIEDSYRSNGKSISLESRPRNSDMEQSAWLIEEASPRDETEAYIVKLTKILDESYLNHNTFDKLMREADGIPFRVKEPDKNNYYDREMPRREMEIVLRTGEGKLVLLRDAANSGLHIIEVGEIVVLNLPKRKEETSIPFVSTLTDRRRR